MDTNMIITQELSKRFNDFLAVDRVSLEVGAGEVLALLGPNGAGKTTTVRLLTSILHPSEGSARVAGFDIETQPQQVRSSVGVLTENHGLYNRMPAFDYLDFFGQIYGMRVNERRVRITKLLKDFNLLNDSKRRIGEFSKGMRQKLALARALLHSPPVLLLDEPTSAMDPESARLVRDSIKELRTEDRAVMICTHNLAEAEDLADRIAIIRRGKIIASGSPSSLKDELLGFPVYEINLAEKLNDHLPELPGDVEVTEVGSDWLRYRSSNPQAMNPMVLKRMVDQDYKVVGMFEVSRSLEQVYLQAVSEDEDNHVA
jgi:ABC-2 type transport system ATP-binding protein